MELLTLVDKSKYVFVLETNGITLGHDIEYAGPFQIQNLHVRVSIKGTNKKRYNALTGAESNSYELPFKALKNLIDFNISCNACL